VVSRGRRGKKSRTLLGTEKPRLRAGEHRKGEKTVTLGEGGRTDKGIFSQNRRCEVGTGGPEKEKKKKENMFSKN